ncbi:MAG TPA: sulfotransferase domain-containing protein [Terriglobales bacterium]|nr:sulfotransferase domain-containing protein [Terriglobales bacterium]
MIYGLKRVIKYVLGTDIAGRNLAVFPDDTFIVSYPRSGNTWTRFLVANLVYPNQAVTFANIEQLIPDSEAMSSRYVKRIPRPRIIKSHQYFDPRYGKIIYIVRDPRDVALSYYDFARKYRQIENDYPLTSFASDFVAGRLSSSDWGTWGENVASWLYTRGSQPQFLLLRYEDMLRDTEAELGKISRLLGMEATPERLRTAIERSSAERMRRLEADQGDQWVSTKNKRSDIPFVRTASSGLWKEKLPASSALEIESAWGPLMRELGYSLTTNRGEYGTAVESPELVKEHR